MDITFWIYFVCFKYILLDLDLSLSIISLNPTNIVELERVEYICNKITYFIKFGNLHMYFKIKVVNGTFL
jgi:hypothetical protein